MRIGLELLAAPRLDQKLRISPEQRIALAHRLALQLGAMFKEGPAAPEETIKIVLDRTVAAIPGEAGATMREILEALPGIEKNLASSARTLGLTNEKRLQDFALEKFYTDKKGIFFDDDHEAGKRTRLADVTKVYHQPEWAAAEIERVRALMGQDVGTSGALVEEYSRLSKAVQVAEGLRESVGQMVTILHLLLAAKDPITGETVQALLREQAVIETYIPIASERIQKRLVTSLLTIRKSDNPERYENAMLNALGATILVGMGVLAPELFELASLSAERVRANEEQFKKIGFSPDALKRLFGESQKKGVYWNRWKTLKRRPGALTDEAVLSFITERVRRDRGQLLDAVEHEHFFAQAKAYALEVRALKGAENENERALAITDMENHVSEMLGSQSVHECLMKLAASSWYRELGMLG